MHAYNASLHRIAFCLQIMRCSHRITMQSVMKEHLINIVLQDVAAIPQSTKVELSGLYLLLCLTRLWRMRYGHFKSELLRKRSIYVAHPLRV